MAGMDKDRYVAVIDQDKVTDEVRDIATKYDPLNRSGRGEGFHVDDDGELHIDDENVMEEHRLIEKKIPNDAVKILRLPVEEGQLVHQYGENSFRLYELPAPVEGQVVGLLGRNGVGKSTALQILAGLLTPNLGGYDEQPAMDDVIDRFRGTAIQNHLEAVRDGEVDAAYKPQQVDRIPDQHSGTVHDLLAENDEQDRLDELAAALEIETVLDRSLDDLSGGELQRVAVAATLLQDADLYLVDEPSSYLDIGQRLSLAELLREVAADGAKVVVVEHDLAALDLLADTVHLLYGEPGGFGVVSNPLSVKNGINRFLEGELPDENLRIRDEAIDFHTRKERRVDTEQEILSFPAMEKSFDTFSLETAAGSIHEQEVLGVLGRNALGKTTFAKMLAGELQPDTATVDVAASISYKPQYIDTEFDGTVRMLLRQEADIHSQRFKTRIKNPFDLEQLYENRVQDLSGGELQRVGIAAALGRDADMYLLDEPSAYLDVDRRVQLAKQLRTFVEAEETACMVIDHDLMLLDYVADRSIVFHGEPGVEGRATAPLGAADGINRFLADIGITFRRDPDTGRPRANTPGSQKDEEQKDEEDFFAAD
ncbi:MAG: ribosome biogenesis/translation initiation ATPase RLI [Candidatus Nanohaloarchaea archaeon]|nr:ribosome biogenesis/translation initiation ATPase RLI [Candidatus Nanohaloarchaea archaeon]